MKCITICQPYAQLIASGQKRAENRTWALQHRGSLAIHAGKSRAWLDTYWPLPPDMIFGAVLAIVDVIDCLHIDAIRAGMIPENLMWLQTHEHASGPWCWVLANVRPVKPMPCRGQMGLFDIDGKLLEPIGPLLDDPEADGLFAACWSNVLEG